MNIAHRGGAQLMPENTLAAFGDALKRGYDGVELDVQLSLDGVVVVHHDFRLMADVARKSGIWLTEPGPRIKDLTIEQLRQFDVGTFRPRSSYALKHPDVTAVIASVPTLEEVAILASQAQHRFLLFVELKCNLSQDSADPIALADATMKVIAQAGLHDKVIFVGFDWRALLHIRQRDPKALCWFTTDMLQGEVRPIIDMIAQAGAQGWFPNQVNASASTVAYAHERGLKVGAWTVNQPEEMAKLMGLDAICTDRPDLLEALEQGRR
jgi:glycerophosphoryl diester phosphodiesterase